MTPGLEILLPQPRVLRLQRTAPCLTAPGGHVKSDMRAPAWCVQLVVGTRVDTHMLFGLLIPTAPS
jgi:hypothetical protein